MAADYFHVLQLPRRPWLDEAVLRENFQRLAVAAHPDVVGGSNAGFAELNTAWQTLRQPAARLRHYLELEHPEALRTAPQPPTELSDLFMDIADHQQDALQLVTEFGKAVSPLARALLEPRRVALRKHLQELAEGIIGRSTTIHEALQTGRLSPTELAANFHRLVYLDKWAEQLRETLLALDQGRLSR